MNNTGIYRIQIGDYFYFGQSQDLKNRKSAHLCALRKGNHKNPKMQNVYNKYQDFSFSAIVYAEIKELNQIEQGLLDIYCGNNLCMNIALDASAPARGLRRSEETLRKMSEAQIGTKNHFYGKKHSEKSKKKMSEAKKGVNNPTYNPEIFTFIHDEHGEITCTRHEFLSKYNLDGSNVTKVIKGKYQQHKGWRLKK